MTSPLCRSVAIALCLLAFTSIASAQNQSRFGLRAGPRFNLNSVNPDGARMRGVNNLTGGITAVYNLRLRNNLCFEAGLGYGSQRHKVRFMLPLSNFDPLAVSNLKGRELQFNQTYTLPHVGLNLAMGYSFAVKPGYRLDLMGGVSGIWDLRAYNRVGELDFSYRQDDKAEYTQIAILQLFESFGNGDRSTTPTAAKFGTPTPNFDVYALLRREVKTVVFSELNLGVRISCAAYLNGTPNLTYYYIEKTGGPKTVETYTNRNAGFQVTIGGSF